MKKLKFKAREKQRVLEQWDGTAAGARRAARFFQCSERSIYRWHKQFDGTLESLANKPPNNYQPRQHTAKQTKLLKKVLDEHPNISRLELYTRLRLEMGYIYHIRTMDREIRRQGFIVPKSERVKAESQPYDTPDTIGVKWQIDVKFVPANCLQNIPDSAYYYRDGHRLYQYTCIDEASRKRFMYIYDV